MAIGDDFSIALNGDIRYTGSGANYAVLELHRWLQGLADDAESTGDDFLDITSFTPSERATDNIITLLDHSANGGPTYNIDDTAAEHLYDGSILQGSADNGGTTLFAGLEFVGNVVSGTVPQIIQDDKVLSPYWGTGINADPTANIIMRVMVKVRENGADIDGRRVRGVAAELGASRAEFSTTANPGNNTVALFTNSDLNNQTAETTIRGWTTIDWVEGFQLIDITGDAVDEEYYFEGDKGSQSLNDAYEFFKMVQARASAADSATETGTNYVVDNATITGQGQEFTARTVTTVGEKLVGCSFFLKVGGGTPTGTMVAELYDSDDVATAAPTGAVLATSEPIDVNRLTASYAEVFFRFNDNVTLTNGQAYFIVIRHANGGASDFVHVRGAAAGSHAGNRAEDSGGWTGDAGSDLSFQVLASPTFFGRPGELHRGPTHEVVYDTESGNFSELETLYWGTRVTYDTLSGSFTVGEYVRFEQAGVVVNGGKVLADSGTVLTVALDVLTQNLGDGDAIIGNSSGATANINVTIVDDDKAGGEGVLLALDDNGTTGDFYLQLISGAAPVDNLQISGRTSAQTALVNATVTSRSLSPSGSFIGQSTGTNIIGAYGVAFQPADVGAQDQFFDLTNTPRQPPNNVTFTVTGLVSGEDYVLVGPRLGSVLDTAQFGLNTTLSGAAETALVIDTSIPSDTPSEGNTSNTRLRVELDTGRFRKQAYDSWTGSTFTIPSTDYSGANQATAANDVWLAYIDTLAGASQESFTAVYSSDRDLFVRVRDGGATPIKTFETPATFGNANSSIAAIRTSDA